MDNTILDVVLPKEDPKIIKVIGVGGGGGNAVTHMYREGIHDVTFLLCNTDKQAMNGSEVPNRLVLGETITKGLGAGNQPNRARDAAEESREDIRTLLDDGTQMVFITAGMGGGTGTGAAPVIARIAKDMDILTVGIVTIPFLFEGSRKISQALDGVEAISKNVDALLVISNERLREIYPDFTIKNAFAKADDMLAIAAKSIAEIITIPGLINLDFADVNTTMKNGGVALISIGYGQGEGRVKAAIDDALTSPLLNNNDVFSAQKILFNISFSEESELLMEEMEDVNDFMARFKSAFDVIWGTAVDNSLGGRIKIAILATGFEMDDIPEMAELLRIKEPEEKDPRIEKYYPDFDKQAGEIKVVILKPEELDDDALIDLLENTPTYRRNLKDIDNYRNVRKKAVPSLKQPATNAARDSEGGIFIDF
jgi:cell division protein FtsZ